VDLAARTPTLTSKYFDEDREVFGDTVDIDIGALRQLESLRGDCNADCRTDIGKNHLLYSALHSRIRWM